MGFIVMDYLLLLSSVWLLSFLAKVYPQNILIPLLLSSPSCVWFCTGLPCTMEKEMSAGSDSFTCSSIVVGLACFSHLVVFRMPSIQYYTGLAASLHSSLVEEH